MSSYAKAQEYRLVEYFSKRPDVEFLKYYGSRKTHSGDFLIRINNRQIRVDHKSTTNESQVRIQKEWLPKMTGTVLRCSDEEGTSTPLITLTAKNHRTIWAMCYFSLVTINSFPEKIIKEWSKSLMVTTGWLHDLDDEAGLIDFNGYQAKIMKLETFIKEIKDV